MSDMKKIVLTIEVPWTEANSGYISAVCDQFTVEDGDLNCVLLFTDQIFLHGEMVKAAPQE